MSHKTITIFSPELPASEETMLSSRGWQEEAGVFIQAHAVDVAVLENNVRDFFASINSVLDSTKEVEKKDFRLEEIEFTLQLSAEGQVGFLGTGAKAAGQGGIKFVIKRT
jgi:hypothetical protein